MYIGISLIALVEKIELSLAGQEMNAQKYVVLKILDKIKHWLYVII